MQCFAIKSVSNGYKSISDINQGMCPLYDVQFCPDLNDQQCLLASNLRSGDSTNCTWHKWVSRRGSFNPTRECLSVEHIICNLLPLKKLHCNFRRLARNYCQNVKINFESGECGDTEIMFFSFDTLLFGQDTRAYGQTCLFCFQQKLC